MSFGEGLTKDQIPQVNKHIIAGVQFISEFREFVKERAQLEKEYSNKLEALAKKYQQRKSFGLGGLSVSNDPFGSQSVRHSSSDVASISGTISGSLTSSEGLGLDAAQSTLIRALSSLLDETENIANERAVLSEYLISDICDPLKVLAQKTEESRKKNLAFSKKMTEERDKFYTEKDKAKSRYEESCTEVQTSRQKQEKTLDAKSMEKLQKQYFQDVVDRNNNKNLYVLAVHVANSHKRKHYEEDVPELLNHLQTLSESWIDHLKGFWAQYIDFEMNCLDDSKSRLETISEAISLVNKKSESSLFVSCHPTHWTQPGDFEFQSFQDFSEDATLISEEASKVFLFNKLSKAQSLSDELESDVAYKQKELDGLSNLFEAYSDNPSTGDPDEVRENLFEAWRDLVIMKSNHLTHATEIDVISSSIGSNDLGGTPHEFKASSFTIPTTCDYCEATIWGLSRHGATCKECGFNCHSKCELKVPPNCSQVKGGAKANRKPLANYATLAAKTAPFLKNAPSSGRQPIPASFTESHDSPFETPKLPSSNIKSTALALYDYDAADDAELSIKEGQSIEIIENDDGSGWLTARIGEKSGLVPAAYLQLQDSAPDNPNTIHATPQVQAQALYDFDAQTDIELSIRTGDVINVTNQSVAEGWWEGTLNGQTGQFPANYVQLI